MTSAISLSDLRRRSGGFTLTEILVVIVIIVILAGILLPTLIKAYAQADKTKTAATLQVLGIGLEAYKQDFGDYPRFAIDTAGTASIDTAPQRGAVLLCRSLIGPDPATIDGLDGPGFKARIVGGTPIGKTYGPYINTDRLKIISYTIPAAGANPAVSTFEIGDSNSQPILYFPTSPVKRDVTTTAGTYVNNVAYSVTANTPALNPYINFYDNSDTTLFTGITYFEVMIGDNVGTPNGKIDIGESPINVPYLLYAAGADGKFGPTTVAPATTGLADMKACDDVTNVQK